MGYAEGEEDFETYFNIGMEKAQVYRLASRRDLAIPVIEELYNLELDEDQKAQLDEFKCIMEIEQRVITNELAIDGEVQIDELLAACRGIEYRVARPGISNHIKYTEDIQLTVIPNPATSNLTISANLEHYNARIINPIGQILFSDNVNYKTTVDVSSFTKGIYFLTIESSGKIIEKRTIAIQ